MERTLRNVLVVSLGFLLLFTAYGGLQSLQSSLYSEEGLGVTVLSTLYGAVLLSSMLLPPLLIRTLGCKWTIVASMSCYVAFSLGNFYASWYTLIPTSILLGLGAAPLWSAQGTYLTLMGNVQAEEAGRVARDVVNRYFGIFFLIFQSSGVWGNLISSLVFGQLPTHEPIPEQQLLSCGARDCLMAKVPTNSTQRVPQKLIYTLLGIYTGSGVLAVLLVALFLEPVRDVPQKSEAENRSPSFRSTLLSTFKLFGDKRLRFLILLPMYSGFEQAFLAGDYTRSYATCALGIQFVGYVMICFSATNALCSELYGKLSQHTGRVALYMLGAVTHLSCIVALLLWKPSPDQLAVFFVFAGLWGVADAVWQTQNNGRDLGGSGLGSRLAALSLPGEAIGVGEPRGRTAAPAVPNDKPVAGPPPAGAGLQGTPHARASPPPETVAQASASTLKGPHTKPGKGCCRKPRDTPHDNSLDVSNGRGEDVWFSSPETREASPWLPRCC
ncbi:protein unc-93 homolog A isoform X1 [Pteropus medius]|uniref:protein unc-93 homolog A isoform X1 n=1 Tax=Pteropus vampyrus TaxID=132908 RepID=UPI00196AA2B1|nr:protein unc-93 homolog A isoform X1 [Pteropus giganteus]